MEIIHPKYKTLSPNVDFLCDEAVMIQAWKKCDSFIRHRNWYADILELEKTSLMLPKLIPAWCKKVADRDVKPKKKMRLVQAPKNGLWEFPKDVKKKAAAWRYASQADSVDEPGSDGGPGLRPLAHLGIREQTLAAAAMLCLADIIESIQGNTDQDSYKEAQEKGVFSYGNRLFCDWKKLSNEKEQARFRWGSATTYSQFFEDYQRFLFRPSEICQAAPINLSKEKLFVVKLDLSKFYDRIDRNKLIEEIEEIVKDYSIGFEAHVPDQVILDDFYELLEDIMGWKWSNSAKLANESLEDVGLPQGLVASGFFANAYMHRFDQEMGKLIGKTLKEDGQQFRLLDYCRYVDDLLVVVAVKKSIKATQVESIVSTRISKKLNRHCKNQELKLELNKEKTEAIAWEDFVGLGSTSRFMRGVQKQISQAPDPVTLANATGNLDQLLWLADTVDGETSAGTNVLELAHIEKPKADVRDDTIQRFAANRLRAVLRLRRSMADPLKKDESGSSNPVSERESLDHEIENIARKLIACFGCPGSQIIKW